jgi:hypothetical protein
MMKSRKKYMSTGWVVSWLMTLKICEELDLILIHHPRLAFCPPVPGFSSASFTLILNDVGHSITTRHWLCLSFGKWVYIGKIEMPANFQLSTASVSQVTAF